MSRKEIVAIRVGFLMQFDKYVREIIGDDDITVNIWLAFGVPDESTEEDLFEIAEDDKSWNDCIECFAQCCRTAEMI